MPCYRTGSPPRQVTRILRALAVWLIATVVGMALVVLLPEHWFGDEALLRFSTRHGPSATDSLGLAIALLGWLFYLHALWLERRKLRPRWAVLTLVIGAVAMTAGCVAAVMADRDGWWPVLALGAMAFQAMLCFTVPGRTASG